MTDGFEEPSLRPAFDDGAPGGLTVITVTYKTPSIDLSWIPAGVEVIVVHNDRHDTSISPTRTVVHLGNGTNIGFGAAVNLALRAAEGRRLILVNPDTELTPEHFEALASGTEHEVVVVPLTDFNGAPTSVVNRYPTVLSLLLTAARVGRLIARSSPMRRALLPFLGAWGRAHRQSLADRRDGVIHRWPMGTHWASAAVVSYPTDLLRAVGGFDSRYFLYLEDVDLCRRLARFSPGLEIVMPNVPSGRHAVSASSSSSTSRRRADLEQARSAALYAANERGSQWEVAAAALRVLCRWRQHRV